MHTKMDPVVKARWVTALRSGAYKQGCGLLRTASDNFCCLGVLCNLHAEDHPEIAAEQTSPTAYMGLVGMPPAAVTNWAQLNTVDAMLLAKKNDHGATFDEIARYIERNL